MADAKVEGWMGRPACTTIGHHRRSAHRGSTNPVNAAAGVATNRKVTANFTEAIDPATCTNATFTLVPAVAGSSVSCVGKVAIFTPR